MMKSKQSITGSYDVNRSRRRFVQGVAAGSTLLGLGLSPGRLFAGSDPRSGPQALRGKQFDLDIDYRPINFTGKSV